MRNDALTRAVTLISNEIEELKINFDCRRCRVCLLDDCELAGRFSALEFFRGNLRKREEFDAWREDLRRTTMPDRKPALDDFESAFEAWGHA